MTFPESEFSAHITFSIFEDENGCLEDLDCELKLLIAVLWKELHLIQVHVSLSQVNVGLLPCAETAKDLINLLILDHLVKDDQCPGVKHLVNCGPIVLVLNSDPIFVNLVLRRLQGIADFGVEL